MMMLPRKTQFNLSLLLCSLCLGLPVKAASGKATSESVSPVHKIVPLDHASELKNRFRVDYLVSSMTLLVQREFDSPPVVVVLPDGSKWYANRHPSNVRWVDGSTGDIIYIESPQAGPWQLMGKVVPGSQIRKVSKLDIEVQPLPQPLFQGEQIKVTAQLQGDAERIRMPGLDYLVDWKAHFVSKRRAGDENFAAGDIIVGSYKDNGEKLDEQPDDGLFTSDISLKQPWGEYDFVVQARNNIFERQVSLPFTLSARPVNTELLTPEDPLSGQWKLKVLVDDSVVRLKETHISLELQGPTGLPQPLDFDSPTQGVTELPLPMVSEVGNYRIGGSVATTTVTGREILLNLPDRFFNVAPVAAPLPNAQELAAIRSQQVQEEETITQQNALYWIVGVNAAVLLFGVIGLLLWRQRQKKQQLAASAKLQAHHEETNRSQVVPSLDEIDLTIPEEFDKNR